MNRSRSRSIWAAFAVAVAATVGSGAAQARDVYWSVDIQAPIYPAGRVGTSISNAPRASYYAAPLVVAQPVYYVPAPVAYLPQPVYAPHRVVYHPYPVYYRPEPYRGHKGKWKQGRHHRHGDHDDD